jgi:hypothetical protein
MPNPAKKYEEPIRFQSKLLQTLNFGFTLEWETLALAIDKNCAHNTKGNPTRSTQGISSNMFHTNHKEMPQHNY